MTQTFDAYRDNYKDVVQDSISFSGLKHDFFMQAKADIFQRILSEKFPHQQINDLNYLDVGCGVGSFHPFVKGWFKSISGCDVSVESIERAKEEKPFADYKTYQGTRLPYEYGSFDVLTTICVMHHVPVDQWPVFVGELKRVLRPGGIACIIEHNPYNPGTRLAVSRCPFDEDAVLLSSQKSESLIREAGFQSWESRHFLLLPFANTWSRKIEAAVQRLPLGAQYVTIGQA